MGITDKTTSLKKITYELKNHLEAAASAIGAKRVFNKVTARIMLETECNLIEQIGIDSEYARGLAKSFGIYKRDELTDFIFENKEVVKTFLIAADKWINRRSNIDMAVSAY